MPDRRGGPAVRIRDAVDAHKGFTAARRMRTLFLGT